MKLSKTALLNPAHHGPIQPDIMNQSYYRQRILSWNATTNKDLALFYEFKTLPTLEEPVLMVPDACLDIIIECDPNSTRAFFLGANFTPRYLPLRQNTVYFGFKPYTEKGMVKNIESNFKPLTSACIDLEELIDIDDLCEKLTMQDSFDKRIQLFKDFAVKRLINYDYKPDFIENILCELCENGGHLSLSDLFKSIGYSDRYCRQLFNASYGISPKQYSKIMRFQDTITCFSQQSSAWSDHFHNRLLQNYYDQSHSIKEFKSFTTMPPATFKKYIINR